MPTSSGYPFGTYYDFSVSSLFSILTSVFETIASLIKSFNYGWILSSSLKESGLLLNNDFTLSQKWNFDTFISPVVRVPVFPTHISWSVAHVYIASKFLIKILSFFKLLTDRAIAMDTATGKPSGIATINKTTDIIAELPI